MEYVGDNTWKKDGCNTTQINDTVVECSCDHMTPFAVLLVSNNQFIQAITKRLIMQKSLCVDIMIFDSLLQYHIPSVSPTL